MRLCDIISGCDADIEIYGITDDSRCVKTGFVFFANGKKFIDRAYLAGACAVVCEKGVEVAKNLPIPVFFVENVKMAYAVSCQKLCGMPGESMRLVAVTGTNGKTSTTMILRRIFSYAGRKCGVIGTTGNYIGDEKLETDYTTPPPDKLAKILMKMKDAGVEYVFIEASSHALDQHRLGGLEFDAGIFTNLSRDHMDYHKSVDEYAAAKARLFEKSRRSVINLDDAHAKYMGFHSSGEVVYFSKHDKSADYTAKNIECKIGRTSFDLCGDDLVHISTALTGGFYVYNASLSVIAAALLGIDEKTSAAALRDMPIIDGRMERVIFDSVDVLIDYAHTPDALENALKTLKPLTRGRLIVVFGCGGNRDAGKRAEMGEIAARYADLTVITSDNPRNEDPEEIIRQIECGVPSGALYEKVTDRAEAIRFALDTAKDGDVVLIAGKGHENYVIDAAGKRHYSDKEQILEYFKRNG
ncbi:MAG: UDP-N-acetylmuramoyl-L-alanyl-D-glutamate--2,6-diaminopimelate ligase [Clostridia bacterium]|nr:UDP-N-acetylmuramoyl-L-alanyl-D-glutamate--2,6-diaminopimelate ligase [Clostridia bacterium]